MKQLLIFILSFISILSFAVSRGDIQTQDYGNIRVLSASNYDFEEFRKAFIIGQLAKKLVDELQYIDSVYLDFYHNHYQLDDFTPIYHVGVQQIGEKGRNSITGEEKIVIRQYAYQYDFEGMLKLLEYAIENKTQIKQQQSIKRNASAHGTRSFLSINDKVIKEVLQKPISEILNITLQTRVDRPVLTKELKPSAGTIDYYWQNNMYYVFHNTPLRGEKENKDITIMKLTNIYTFHSLYPMTVVFDNSESFYCIHPNRRDKETSAYIPSRKQTIEAMTQIDRGKKIEAISHNDISIFFQYNYGVIGTSFPRRLLLYFSEADTLIQDAYAFNNIVEDSIWRKASHAEIREMEKKPEVYDLTTWKKQLNFIKEYQTSGTNNRIKKPELISYTAVDDNEVIDIKDFLGEGWEQTIERIRKNIPESLMQRMRPRANAEAYYKRKTEILRQYQRPENDLKLLKLTWTVDDEPFHTYAVISEFHDSVIYDDIISYLSNFPINIVRGSFRYNEWQLYPYL